MSSGRGYETRGTSTIIADSDDMRGSKSSAVETELGPYDRAIIQDCVNKNMDIHDTFVACQQNRQQNSRPMITQPAVKEYYDKCEKDAAKENCVLTGVQTKNFVEFQIVGPAKNVLGSIRIPVCEPMAQDIARHGVGITATVGLTGDLPATGRVVDNKNLPCLPGSFWNKSK